MDTKPEPVQVAQIEWSPVSYWQVERDGHKLTVWRYDPHTPCDRSGDMPFGRVFACSLKNPLNFKAVLLLILNTCRQSPAVKSGAVSDLIIAVQNEFVKILTEQEADAPTTSD